MSLAGLSLAELAVWFTGTALVVSGLYLLRMRRQRLVVPFAALWQQVARESASSRLWRRFRRLASYLLQLVVVAALCLVAGDPRPGEWFRTPRHVALVLDVSASMGGPADGGTRLDLARRAAHGELMALHPLDRVTIMAAGPLAAVVSPLHDDPHASEAALQSLSPLPGEAALAEAVRLASAAVGSDPEGRVVIVTDGALDEPAREALTTCTSQRSPECRVILVGGDEESVAIASFAARRDPRDPERAVAMVELSNLGERARVLRLRVTANELPLAERLVELPPATRHVEVISDLDTATPQLRAELEAAEPSPAPSTGSPLDDVAHAVVPPPTPFRVDLVTDGTDLFLEAALLAQDDHLRVRVLGLEEAHQATGDLVFVDVGDAPLPTLPTTGRPVVVFDPHRRPTSDFPIARAEELRRPVLTEVARRHPIFDGVVFKDVNLARATTLRLEAGDEVLASCAGAPVIVLRPGPPTRLAVGFDPRQSDLVLRTAFVVFVTNVLRYFEERRPGFVTSLPVGRRQLLTLRELGLERVGTTAIRIRPYASADAAPPAAAEFIVPVDEGTFGLRPESTGLYAIEALSGDQVVGRGDLAVNMNAGDDAGSNLRNTLRDSLGFAQAPPTAEATTSSGAGDDEDSDAALPFAARPLWQLLLFFALALLALEWATYHRRWTV